MAHSRISNRLRPEHFSTELRRKIYAAIVESARDSKNGQSADSVTIHSKLVDNNVAIGLSDLTRLIDGVVGSPNVDGYAEIVIEDWRRRELELLAIVTKNRANDYEPSDQILDEIQDRIIRLRELKEDRWSTSGDVIDRLMAFSTSVYKGLAKAPIYPSGIETLDRMLGGGFWGGTMTFLAGGPGVGKSLIMAQAAMNLAINGTRVAIISFEMPPDDLILRCVTALTEINTLKLKRMELTTTQYNSVQQALANLKDLMDNRLFFYDGSLDIDQFVRETRARITANGIQLLFLDNVHAFPGADDVATLGGISQQLQSLVRETGVTFVSLAHINQAKTVSAQDKRPHPEAILGSKGLMRVADFVINLHRPEQTDPGTMDRGYIYFLLAKARGGSGASEMDSAYPSMRALFDGARMRITEPIR
jgi:replicative DNA helicase